MSQSSVALVRPGSLRADMDVAVDEARHHRLVRQIDHARAGRVTKPGSTDWMRSSWTRSSTPDTIELRSMSNMVTAWLTTGEAVGGGGVPEDGPVVPWL